MAVTVVNNYIGYAKYDTDTKNVVKSTQKATDKTYSSSREYKNYLTKKYNCLTNKDYPVMVNSSLLKKAATDERTAQWLEYNLSIMPQAIAKEKAMIEARGAKIISYSCTINGYDSMTTLVCTTTDSDGKIAKENEKKRTEEKREEQTDMKIVDTLTYDRDCNLFYKEHKTENLKSMQETLKNRMDKAVSVEFSEEGMIALRGKVQEINLERGDIGIYTELSTPMEEIEMEHFWAMREQCGLTLKDGAYNLKDVKKEIMQAYETRYNEIVKAHENGDREVDYALSGKCFVTRKDDLAGLDRAYQRQLAYMMGYITCQQTSDGTKFFGT